MDQTEIEKIISTLYMADMSGVADDRLTVWLTSSLVDRAIEDNEMGSI